jgi:ribose-phosphate pyrophosphokinase
VQRIASSKLKELVVTDTVPVPDSKRIEKITVLPLASLIGEAIHRIHAGLSVGAMFQ